MGTEPLCPAAGEHCDAGVTNRLAGAEVANETAFIQRPHPEPGGFVINRPQAHDDCAHTRNLERAPKTKNALASPDTSETRVTCGEDCPFDTVEVERHNLLGCENAIIGAWRRAASTIRTSQRQPGQRERALDRQRGRAGSRTG